MKSLRIAHVPFLPAIAVALWLGAVLASGLAVTPAGAQNYPERQGMSAEQACSNDAYRLCERFIPDRGKVGACLRRNKRALSSECRVFFGGRKLRRR
jgi:hypothetical protein